MLPRRRSMPGPGQPPGVPGLAGSTPQPMPPPAVISRAPKGDLPTSGFAGWMARAQRPVVLRLPRGMAVGAVALALALMLLSYWVGHVLGVRSVRLRDEGRRQSEEQQAEQTRQRLLEPSQGMPAPPVASRVAPASSSAQAPQARSLPPIPVSATVSPTTERRAGGLNYLVLETYPLANEGQIHPEALELVQFLRENGVDAGIVPGHNRRSFQVMALKGFTREQLSGPAREYEKELRRLGRLWKAQHKGSTDLGTMYMDRYEGP